MNRLKLAGLSSIIMLAGMSAQAYTVTGKINGHGGRILLISHRADAGADTIGNMVSKDGTFSFKGVAKTPLDAEITAVNTRVRIPVYLEGNNAYTVTGDVDAPKKWDVVGGGKLQEARRKYALLENESEQKRDSISAYFKANHDMSDYFWQLQMKGALQKEGERFEEAEDEFIKSNDNMVSASVLRWRKSALVRSKKLAEKYHLLGSNALKSAPAQALKSDVEKISAITVGGIAPDFKMKTPEGKEISLHGIKAKVKILDFWASWCGPCRAENPNVKKIYDRFHPKGLEVVSVSVDTDKNAWIKAIQKDGLNWIHISDLGEAPNTAKSVYNVYAIPMMFILDENNRIISEGLRGERLEKFIEEQFAK